MRLRRAAALETRLKHVPEDARACILLGTDYAELGREASALREVQLAVTLRANEASILYNAACVYCLLNKKSEAQEALGDPEFERLYLENPPPSPSNALDRPALIRTPPANPVQLSRFCKFPLHQRT
jgi:hypothetical protein